MQLETSLKITSSERILILGNGYMGNHLSTHLKNKGHAVFKVSTAELDYHKISNLTRYVLNENITLLINCSGFTGRPNIDEAEVKKELCYELNVASPLRVNHMCQRLGIRYVHISSGCVFEGYEKEWDEEDVPNYGFFQNHSSFYSKTKHLFEMLSKDLPGRVIRIRMPFGPDHSQRNYLSKIKSYDKLIDFQNSKTYIPDLCNFTSTMIEKWYEKQRETYNVVNPEPLWTNQVCEILTKYGQENPDWKFIPIQDLGTAAGRSNCVLNCAKANEIYPMLTETEALKEIYR